MLDDGDSRRGGRSRELQRSHQIAAVAPDVVRDLGDVGRKQIAAQPELHLGAIGSHRHVARFTLDSQGCKSGHFDLSRLDIVRPVKGHDHPHRAVRRGRQPHP